MVETMNQSSENLGSSILLSDTNRHNLILGVGRVGGKKPICLQINALNC